VYCKKSNLHQAETEFSQLVDLAASGDEILIAGSGNRLPIGLLWIQGQDPSPEGFFAGVEFSFSLHLTSNLPLFPLHWLLDLRVCRTAAANRFLWASKLQLDYHPDLRSTDRRRCRG
jgi:hypothetical protein